MPNVDEIRKIYADNRSTKAVSIWCDSVSKLGIYRQKNVMRHSLPQFSEFLISETTGRIEKKIKGDVIMVRTSSIFMQNLVEIRRGMKKNKSWVFFSVFTGRATAVIAFTQQAILMFFAPQGRHDSRLA